MISLRCCKQHKRNVKQVEVDKKLVKDYIISVVKKLPDLDNYGNGIACPNCNCDMAKTDLKKLFSKEEISKYLDRVCVRCSYIFDDDELKTGKCQVLSCKQSHKICSNCIHSQVLKAGGDKQGHFVYSIYECPKCKVKCEFREIHLHDNHYIDPVSYTHLTLPTICSV
eukprot:TRINITY_DN5259_c0_g5_i1.p1 TRINITY_DN5259_c0_g5~~TRINITY_DN5259_c0_g5_i1.p1  ORF type:complete len:168 (-),score=0.83 TRINITY_DN5259_c0_g5_i1:40-543(-)